MNNEKKKEILLENDYSITKGWCMEYEKDDEYNNVIVSVDDFERFKKEEPQDHFYHKDDDYCRLLDEAWECFIDDFALDQDLDLDYDDDEAIFKAYDEIKAKRNKE